MGHPVCPILIKTKALADVIIEFKGGEASGVQAEDAGAAGCARRGSAAHQEQPDRGAQGEVRVPHPAHDAGAEEGRGERQKLLLRLAGGTGSGNDDRVTHPNCKTLPLTWISRFGSW